MGLRRQKGVCRKVTREHGSGVAGPPARVPVSGLEGRPRTGPEGDLELAAQEQVLDHEVVPLADESCQRGEEDAEQLEHPHSLADPAGSRFPLYKTGTGDQNSPCQATISTNVLAGMSRDDATGSAGAEVLEGAAAGALATIAMSAAMFGFRRLGLMGEMPPEKITSRVLDRLGVRRSRIAQDLLASANHVAFGAGGGATFGLVRRWVPSSIPTLPLGVVFASAIWAVSYAGLAPILGLMPPPQKDRVGRPLSMIAAHLVYGTVLAFLVDRFSRRRAGSAAKPARPPAEPGRTRHPSRGGR